MERYYPMRKNDRGHTAIDRKGGYRDRFGRYMSPFDVWLLTLPRSVGNGSKRRAVQCDLSKLISAEAK